jgi:hypothetical protein
MGGKRPSENVYAVHLQSGEEVALRKMDAWILGANSEYPVRGLSPRCS